MKVKNYFELIAWQKAMELTDRIYGATKEFPAEEKFGLATQMRRAAVSVPSNIAEGQGRSSTSGFLHFLSIAHGSVREIETRLRISAKLGYLEKTNDGAAHGPGIRSGAHN